MTNIISNLSVKVFADGADLTQIATLASNPLISGFTTNPSLMRKAGVENYQEFAQEFLKIVRDSPVSFEVFADDLKTMEKQALFGQVPGKFSISFKLTKLGVT